MRLRRRLQIASRGGSTTVGLLCSSSPEFILAWLGLMRLDMAVMLLAYVFSPIPPVQTRSANIDLGLRPHPTDRS